MNKKGFKFSTLLPPSPQEMMSESRFAATFASSNAGLQLRAIKV